MDTRTLHHSNRPRKSPVLEVSQKTKPPNSPMARGTPRLPFYSPTHPRKPTHSGRRPIKTTWSGRRQRRQPRNYNDPRTNLRPSHGRGLYRNPGRPNRKNAKPLQTSHDDATRTRPHIPFKHVYGNLLEGHDTESSNYPQRRRATSPSG